MDGKRRRAKCHLHKGGGQGEKKIRVLKGGSVDGKE